MTKRNGARRGKTRRAPDIYVSLDSDGFPILDDPSLSWRARYETAVSRYTLAVWLMPHLARIPLTRHIYVPAIIDDVLRHLHRDYEVGKGMSSEDFDQYFERYAQEVESEGRAEAWDEHAERLLVKYGSGLGMPTPQANRQ